MRLKTLIQAMLAFALLAPATASAVPTRVPVQGVLADADGAPIADALSVVFNLYADADGDSLVWTEERDVDFDRGFFTVSLGATEPLDAGLFRDNPGGLWLGIAVDGDDEMALVALGTAPFAGLAAFAEDAATVGGLAPDALATADHEHAFGDLIGVPDGLADGDDDTTYAAGDGLALADGVFALRGDCAPGQVLAVGDGGWACADPGDAEGGVISTVELSGTELIINEGGRVTVVDLVSLATDGDADAANELLAGGMLDGTDLVLTDAGGDTRIDLSGLVAGINVDDADADATNELLLGGVLNGTRLELTDGGGLTAIELGGLVAGINIDDADADPANELLTGALLNGTTLELSDNGGLTAVDLAALINDADADPGNELLLGGALSGTTLQLADNGGLTEVDLAALVNDADADPANEIQQLAINATGDLSLSGANTINVHDGVFALSSNLGISGNNIEYADAIEGDDVTQLVELPFTVTYAGVGYANICISTNGWVEFADECGGTNLVNRSLPSSAFDGPVIAAYWDDLTGAVSWGVEGLAPNRVFTIYSNSETFSGDLNMDFTVQIHEGSGLIRVRYLDNDAVGQSATIGFQGAGGRSAKAFPLGYEARVLDDNNSDADPGSIGWSVAPIR